METAPIYQSKNRCLCLYERVGSSLRNGIIKGELPCGKAIPSQKELSDKYNVSEITVRRAISELIKEGFLVTRPGSGTFVIASASQGNVDNNVSRTTRGETREEGAIKSPSPFENIGLVTASFTDGYPFFSKVVHGVKKGFGSVKSMLQFFELPLDFTEDDTKITKNLPISNVSGLLIFSPVNLELVVRCRREKIPYVLLHNDMIDGYSHRILIDYASGVLDAVTYLKEQGRKRIAMVTAYENRLSSGLMSSGFQMALRHGGLKSNSGSIIKAGFGEDHGYSATEQLLKSDNRPDAIIYASDFQAKGGLLAAKEMNIHVPEDLAIVGMGNILRPKEAWVELTTVDLKADKVGQYGIEMLNRLILGEKDVPLCEVITPKLIVRQST